MVISKPKMTPQGDGRFRIEALCGPFRVISRKRFSGPKAVDLLSEIDSNRGIVRHDFFVLPVVALSGF